MPAVGAALGDEAELGRVAEVLPGSMDAAGDGHAVLGLMFLKCISDSFEEQHARLEAKDDVHSVYKSSLSPLPQGGDLGQGLQCPTRLLPPAPGVDFDEQ